MIKRILIFLGVICLLAVPIAANADIIRMNDFYRTNDNIEPLDRYHYFQANGIFGNISFKAAPGSSEEVFTCENGTIIGIYSTYLYKGRYWGFPIKPYHGFWDYGWVLMDELLMLYDSQDFEEENEDRFYVYTGSYDALLSAEKLIIWQWPGSDREKIIREEFIIDTESPRTAYRDAEGREWGKTRVANIISYAGIDPTDPINIWGNRGWICLSDPENNTDIPAFNPAPKPVKWSPNGESNWSSNNTPLLVIILVAAFVAGAAAYIRIARKSNNT